MLREIDFTKQPPIPKLSLAKPNKTIISNLSEALNINVSETLGKINELTFDLPYQIEKEHILIDNPNILNIRERFLIRLIYGVQTEWFIINEIDEKMDDDKDIKSIHAYSLAYELKDKLVRNYSVTSYTPKQVFDDILKETLWSVGIINTDISEKYRSFEVSDSKTVLDFIYEMATTYDAIIRWDTENRQISFKAESEVRIQRGMKFSYGDLLKTLERKIEPDEMCTRLYVYGKDGLNIMMQNPTGTPYIENFNWFLYPFQRDVNKNILSHSNYMSDSLCHAILDLEEKIDANKNSLKTNLTNLQTYQGQLTTSQDEKDVLDTNLSKINNELDIQKANGTFYPYASSTNGTGTMTANPTSLSQYSSYAIMAKITCPVSSIKVDGVTQTITTGRWYLIKKIQNVTSVRLDIMYSGLGSINVYILETTDDEYSNKDGTQGTETPLLTKYCDQYMQEQVDAKQVQVDSIQTNIDNVLKQITDLQTSLSAEVNFTPSQILERNQYIIEQTWSDDNYINDVDLYNDALKKMEEFQSPKETFSISIVNFFELLEEQSRWNKLFLGDEVFIMYEKFGVNVTAMITELHYNFEEKEITLTIENTNQFKNNKDKLIEMLYKSYSTSSQVDMSKYKWNEATTGYNEISDIINNTWDATKRKIVAGANETVEISNRGIVINNPLFPDELLVAQAGVIAVSNDAGNTFKNAITKDGIVGERIFGKILAGNNLTIENTSGKYKFDANGFTIDGGSITITGGGLPSNQLNLKIGGRNYVTGTLVNATQTGNNTANQAKTIYYFVNNISTSIMNQNIGVSFTWSVTGATSGSFYIQGNNPYPALSNTITISSTNTSGVYTGITKVTGVGFTGISLRCDNLPVGAVLTISKLKIETSDKVTDYSPAPEDIDKAINDAQKSADNANTLLYDISSDDRLTPFEKNNVKAEWDIISSEKTNIDAQADIFNVTTEKSAYDTAYNTLNTNITPLLTNLTTTSDIVGANFRGWFKDYYDKRTTLLKAISSASKIYVDNLDIGGKNLIYNSVGKILNSISEADGWTTGTKPDTQNSKLCLRIDNTSTTAEVTKSAKYFAVKASTKYTLRVLVKNTSNMVNFDVWFLSRKTGSTQSIGVGYDYSNQLITNSVGNTTDFKEYIIPFVTKTDDIDGYIRFDNNKSSNGSNASLWIAELKVEEGDKSTSWTPAFEDIDKVIADQTSRIDDMTSDMKITPLEKEQLSRDWEGIKSEYTSLYALATGLSVSTTTYVTAYNNLDGVSPKINIDILSNMSTTYTFPSTTDRDNFKTKYNTYFSESAKLNKACTEQVNSNVSNGLRAGTPYNGVTITSQDGINVTKQTTVNGVTTKYAQVKLNAIEGFKIQKTSDNGSTWVDSFYVDTDGTIIAKDMKVQSVYNNVILSEVYRDTYGGVMKLYDSGGLLNAKLGVESGLGDNRGGTLVLYDDGSSNARLELGIDKRSSSAILNMRDYNGKARITFQADTDLQADGTSKPFFGIRDSSEALLTYFSETNGYINNKAIITSDGGNMYGTLNYSGIQNSIKFTTSSTYDTSYMSWYLGGSRLGWIGNGSTSDNKISVRAEYDDLYLGSDYGDIWLTPSSGSKVKLYDSNRLFISSNMHSHDTSTPVRFYIGQDFSYNPVVIYSSSMTVNGALTVTGKINGQTVGTSDINKKKNVNKYDKSILDIISKTPVYTYHYKNEKDEDPLNLGIVAQEAPQEIVVDVLDSDGNFDCLGINLYSMLTYEWKALQELNQKYNDLTDKYNMLVKKEN